MRDEGKVQVTVGDQKEEPRDLRERTKCLALRIIRLYTALPRTAEAQVLGKQLPRSGTSVGAHYREAQRGKLDADFINKMEGGLQELDETSYRLELLAESRIIPEGKLKDLWKETDELISIFVSIITKVKRKARR